MTDDLRTRLREWMSRLTTDPLNPWDPAETRYVPLEESGRGAVDEIYATIDLQFDTTTQLLSGPRGSGKTTELYRLKGKLEREGFRVAMVDILQFVNQSMPIDVADFLVAVALGVSEEIPPADPEAGFGRRFRDFLGRLNISIEAGPFSVSASGEKVGASAFGVSIDAEIKRQLKGSQAFVSELRGKLAAQLPGLREEIAGFFRDLASQNLTANPDTRGVVVIVDSLEKLRGTQDNDEKVQASVEGLFVHHYDKLKFASHHTVYTAPTYLLFTAPGALPYDGRVQPVPIPQLRNRAGDVDANAKETLKELVEVVAKRIAWPELLGETPRLHQVINASGGHLRDLFLILQQIIKDVYARRLALPVSDANVEESLSSFAHDFSSLTKEKADLLRRIHQAGGILEPAESEVQLMAALMDTQMLLGHTNGRDWYEVHPLARRILDLQ